VFDNKINIISEPILSYLAKKLLKIGIKSNYITIFGFFLGLISFVLICFGHFYFALIFFLLNRFFDGLDGALARLTKATDLGGFYDIVCDFIIYGLLPLGFIIIDKTNSISYAFLLTSFIGTGTTFLASAWYVEKNNKFLKDKKNKSFYYSGGITEGFETIICFVMMLIFREYSGIIAFLFAILCWITVIIRIIKIRKFMINNN
tara:strand:+ start:160 stop:771 length:612 start_codon:yes stop_codon:yes gene_type:complete